MWRSPAAGELSALLAARVADLVRVLLPAGVREGAEWRCGSVLGEKGRSLAVHLVGERAGIWSDFATGERGDALDLVAAVLTGGDMRWAIRWSRTWLGLADDGAPPPIAAVRPPDDDTDAGEDRERRRRLALALLREARPRLAGTPVDAYLRGRGIDLAELGPVPALLYHARCWCREAGRHFPAMLAAIAGPDGQPLACHRTYLAAEGDGWGKAPLKDPKLTLGRYAGGAVRLWRGIPGAAVSAPGVLVVAEGIETALSVAISCPELPVWAAVSLANMGRIALPRWVVSVILAADDDGDNAAAARGRDRAMAHFQAQGREVRLALPPAGAKDFNDALKDHRQ